MALQHTEEHCHTLHHNETHCNTLQQAGVAEFRARGALAECGWGVGAGGRHLTKPRCVVAAGDLLLQYVAVCCSMLQYVAVCCSVFQFVAVCCTVFLEVSSLQQLILLLQQGNHSYVCHNSFIYVP